MGKLSFSTFLHILNFTSSTSNASFTHIDLSSSLGDAKKESSDSTTQYGVTPVEETQREEFTTSRKSRDATAPQSSTDHAINMNENIHGTNGDLLTVPPSLDSTSEALIELSTSVTSPPSASSISEDEPLSSSAYDLLLL
ncbi:hypothetical protein RIF29_24447 [Crotalaria pallida]|uniref:Uncharacterized protein n=1 Tax=Crotalaria pallida TaxID=3830 RepID=A0AAN9EKL4_CROPI